MGDWAKGEFTNAGKPGRRLCLRRRRRPTTAALPSTSTASFFKQSVTPATQQAEMANGEPDSGQELPEGVQPVQGLDSGALGHGADEFDSCAHASAAFVASAQGGGLVPSFAHGMAVTGVSEKRDLRRRDRAFQLRA